MGRCCSSAWAHCALGVKSCCIPEARTKLPSVPGLSCSSCVRSSEGRNVAQVPIVPALGQHRALGALQVLGAVPALQSPELQFPSRRAHFPPWLCWDVSGDPGGQQEAALGCKDQPGASPQREIFTPHLKKFSAPSLVCFSPGLLPKQLLEGLFVYCLNNSTTRL